MDLRVIAVAAIALVGLWCLVVLPAVWLSGTMSQEEDGRAMEHDDDATG